jgi:hypothetical protein
VGPLFTVGGIPPLNGGCTGGALRIDGVPKAAAGDGAPKLLTSGVPLAVVPNILITGVLGPGGCTGVAAPAGITLPLTKPGGFGVTPTG